MIVDIAVPHAIPIVVVYAVCPTSTQYDPYPHTQMVGFIPYCHILMKYSHFIPYSTIQSREWMSDNLHDRRIYVLPFLDIYATAVSLVSCRCSLESSHWYTNRVASDYSHVICRYFNTHECRCFLVESICKPNAVFLNVFDIYTLFKYQYTDLFLYIYI